jgi:hypothetical protein
MRAEERFRRDPGILVIGLRFRAATAQQRSHPKHYTDHDHSIHLFTLP